MMRSAHILSGGSLSTALALLVLGMVVVAASEKSASPSAGEPTSRPSQAELEARLSEQLAGVVLKGTWQVASDDPKRGPVELSPPKPDRYTILSANKAEGDWWSIRARIQFGENDVELPLRLRVTWAEDTPIITVDEVAFPGLGTYSARVMIYRNYYCGTWFGADCFGGVMSGQIVRLADEPGAETDSKPATAGQGA